MGYLLRFWVLFGFCVVACLFVLFGLLLWLGGWCYVIDNCFSVITDCYGGWFLLYVVDGDVGCLFVCFGGFVGVLFKLLSFG